MTNDMILTNISIWWILGLLSIVLLIVFWKGKNSIWGGLTIALIAGLIISFFRESGFESIFILKCGIVGIFVGVIAILLGKISDKLKNKRKTNN